MSHIGPVTPDSLPAPAPFLPPCLLIQVHTRPAVFLSESLESGKSQGVDKEVAEGGKGEDPWTSDKARNQEPGARSQELDESFLVQYWLRSEP